MDSIPLCWAPWGMALIDTDKKVKPCCAYQGTDLGKITDTKSIYDIINDGPWQELKNKLSKQEWPIGCKSCHENELNTEWSTRTYFNTDEYLLSLRDTYNSKIVFMEFNGSNLCNLACLHCNPTYSSKWAIEWKKMRTHLSHDHKFHNTMPNVELVEQNLEQLDLSSLRVIHFKGGEPMLNSETLCVLEYLDKISILQYVDITMFTNGTIKNEKIIALMSKAKSVRITISMDGTGDLNNYIRYGNDVDRENITDTVAMFSSIPGCEISFSVSVMVYNIFNLVAIRDFWLEFKTKYKKTVVFPYFKLAVTSPNYLNPRVLSDSTRKDLIKFYENNQVRTEFEYVIKLLSNGYLGDSVHNEWVDYTKKIEAIRGNSIIKLVPELEKELIYR